MIHLLSVNLHSYHVRRALIPHSVILRRQINEVVPTLVIGQRLLALLAGVAKTSRQPINIHLQLRLFLDLPEKQVEQALVDVRTAEERIAILLQNIVNAVVDMQNGHVEGAASKIIHQHVLVLKTLILRKGNHRRSGLRNDVDYVPARRFDGVLDVLLLIAVERRGNRQHHIREPSTSLILSALANVLHQVVIQFFRGDHSILALPLQLDGGDSFLVGNHFEGPLRLQTLHHRVVVVSGNQPFELVRSAIGMEALGFLRRTPHDQLVVPAHDRRNVDSSVSIVHILQQTIGIFVHSGRIRRPQIDTECILSCNLHDSQCVKRKRKSTKSPQFDAPFSLPETALFNHKLASTRR